MSVLKMDQPVLAEWVEACIASQRVIGVQAKGERFVFEPLARAADLRLDYDVTILPPKKILQPPRENLLKFACGACAFESAPDDSRPTVLFGVHPYDMAAITQMDTIFAEKNRDEHYLRRRARLTLVVADVETPSANVFAACMGTATSAGAGGDVRLTRIAAKTVCAEALTDKGRALLALAKGAAPATDKDLDARAQVWARNERNLRKHALNPSLEEIPRLLDRNDEHPVWAEKAEQCYSCGSCNLVCPTCYCFDVRDEVDWSLAQGERTRTWDGCLLGDFAKVAGGHNFRKNRLDRYRHRYYRKGRYMPEKTGQIGCVGCGRCITACTAKIANPVEIFNRLQEAK